MNNLKITRKSKYVIIALIPIAAVLVFFVNNLNKKIKQYRTIVAKSKQYLTNSQYDSSLILLNKAYKLVETDSLKRQIDGLNFFIQGLKKYYIADYVEAFNLFTSAKNLNFKEADYYLGELYFNGWSVNVDFEKGYDYVKRSADKGSKIGLWRLAYCYDKGIGVQANKDKARYYYIEAINELKRLARYNNLEAIAKLGNIYYNGYFVSKDVKKAFDYYHKAANGGLVYAMGKLADMYYNGIGTEKNIEEAIKWYSKAANSGQPEALLKLGLLYLNGENVQKDEKRGIELIELSAQKNYSKAYSQLAYFYENGIYYEKNENKAREYYLKAYSIDKNNVEAIDYLADNYRLGRNVEKDYSKAVEYYKKSISIDSTRIDNYLKIGEIYKYGGYGIKPDEKLYVYYYEKAEQLGSQTAREDLMNYFYEMANQCVKNKKYVEARQYFNLAAKKGHKKANEKTQISNTR